MKGLFALFVLGIQPIRFADVLVLRDGKTIEWSGVRDKGDSYELDTVDGKKVTVRKSDVETLSKPVAQNGPLTGASFSVDTKLVTFDILKMINPKTDEISGSWIFSNGTLVGSGNAAAIPRIQSGCKLPLEYDMKMVVERKSGNDEFFLGLSGGGRRFTLHFDAYQGGWSGPSRIDGKTSNENGIGVPGKFFTNGVPKTIRVSVRKDLLYVKSDDRDFLSWKADWKRAELDPAFSVKDKDAFFLGALSKFQVSHLSITMPLEK